MSASASAAKADPRAALAGIENLARNLDSRWRIPGTNMRFGIDPVVGLVPGLGDAVAALVSAHIIIHGLRAGAPSHILARMIGNVALDAVVGSIPVLGSIFDVYFKANNRNVRLLRRHFDSADR